MVIYIFHALNLKKWAGKMYLIYGTDILRKPFLANVCDNFPLVCIA